MVVDIHAKAYRHYSLCDAQEDHEVLLARHSPSPIHQVTEVSACPCRQLPSNNKRVEGRSLPAGRAIMFRKPKIDAICTKR